MKIMCVISGMTNGGAERVMSTLVNYFSEKHSVRLVILKSSESDYTISSRVEIKAGNIKNKNIFKSIMFVKNNLVEYNPDVVLSFMTNSNIVSLLANKLLKYKHRIVISERANPYKVKGIFSILRKMTYPTANGCVFQTDWAKEYYKNMLKCKTQVIYNPLSPDFNVEAYKGKKEKKIVCTARLYAVKNQKLLIYAFNKIKNKYPDYRVEIYGDGPERNNLQKIIDKLSLNNQVILKGRKQNIIDYIKDASIFVLPSNSEGMSNALLEAMSLGIPSIATDSPIGGSAIIIDNYKNGILIPMEDVDALALAMEKIINDTEFANRISREGTRVLKKFDTDKICAKWEEYLMESTKEKQNEEK